MKPLIEFYNRPDDHDQDHLNGIKKSVTFDLDLRSDYGDEEGKEGGLQVPPKGLAEIGEIGEVEVEDDSMKFSIGSRQHGEEENRNKA